MATEAELTIRLIENIANRLSSEVNEWINNMKLRAEAELIDAAKSVIDKYAGTLEGIDKELFMEKEYRMYMEMINAKRERLMILEDAYKALVDRVKKAFSSLRGTDAYRRYLKRTIEWASGIVGTSDIIIAAYEKDVDVVKSIIDELKLNAKIEPIKEDIMGVIVRTADGSIQVDGTLEAKLFLLEHQIKTLLAKYALGK